MMNFSMRETHPVNISWLPSKGKAYPDTMEIFVAPMTIKEQKLLQGATASNYYTRLLDGIDCSGAQFRKRDLLFCDVQFLDLVRRIFTFELNKKVTVTQYPCYHCKSRNVEVSFNVEDLEFADLKPELFGTVKSYTDNETGELVEQVIPGEIYKFSDGLEVVVSPMTTGEFIEMAAKYVSNAPEDEDFLNKQLTDAYIGSFTYLIKSVVGRDFKDAAERRKFLFDYIGDLYKASDKKILEAIQQDVSCDIKPIITTCPDCEKEVEVYVHPSLTFRQDD